MAFRIYFMPVIGTGASRADGRRPKYDDTDLLGITWSMMDFGNEPFCIVAADVTPSQHTTLAAHADVLSPPADLDQQIGLQLTTVQNALETANMPANWVQSTHTYRTVVRAAAAFCQFMQRLQAFYTGKIFTGGVTLSTTFGSLPAGVRTVLIATANDLNFNTSSLSGSSTLRQIIKAMGDQWPSLEITLGDQVF